jgi:hypothetical protein
MSRQGIPQWTEGTGTLKERYEDIVVPARHIFFGFGNPFRNTDQGGAISVGYTCTMPPQSEIHGAFSSIDITPIAGGI